MGDVGNEGLSLRVDRVQFGPALALGGTDDTLVPVIADIKLGVPIAMPMLTAPIAAGEVAHLKFTVTLDQAAMNQNESLSTVYTVNADQVVAP